MNPINSSSLVQRAAQELGTHAAPAETARKPFSDAMHGHNLKWQPPSVQTVALLRTLPGDIAELKSDQVLADAFSEWKSSGTMPPGLAVQFG